MAYLIRSRSTRSTRRRRSSICLSTSSSTACLGCARAFLGSRSCRCA